MNLRVILITIIFIEYVMKIRVFFTLKSSHRELFNVNGGQLN